MFIIKSLILSNNSSKLYIPLGSASFIFKDGEVSEVMWTDLASLKNNIISNPKEYANRLGAVSLLELYWK